MTFRVGQKVVCVNDSTEEGEPGPYVTKGHIYTVCHTEMGGTDLLLHFDELPSIEIDGWSAGYLAHFFRPVAERKTDISIFTAMLNRQEIDA